MPKKSTGRVSRSRKQSPSSSTIIYLVLFLLLILASITWIQRNTESRQFAEEPTPLLRCDSPCTFNSQCPTGLFCSDSKCRNPQCKDASDCTCIITPTINPNAPTFTPRPTKVPVVATKTVTPTKGTTPTPVPTFGVVPTSGGIIEITPINPTPLATVTPTPSPVFEVDKTPKKSMLEVILNVIADIFCKIFGC